MATSNSKLAIEQAKATVDALGIRPEPVDFQVHRVTLNPENSTVFQEYTEALVHNLNAQAEAYGSSLRVGLDEMRSYLLRLLRERVAQVTRDGKQLIGRSSVVIPSFWVIVLENVGRASDETLGLTLIPEMEDIHEFSTYSDIDAFSSKLRAFSRYGLSFGDQMPRDLTGSWEFMTCQVIKSFVLRHDSSCHPVYALVASTMEMNSLGAVITPRVQYGHTEHFRQLVREFAHVGS